ncbi:hypothetical protein [Tsukamurella pseudospumae]|uniref:Uncharacterized protein n=1 Tax=Tsukamurella pseudospumae TaxID=239498 RepID=A0A137YWY7_9ACTN|nr:hypothetical protein [Tsukamurella pseudospumae]KXO90466.1 hypothetical protein AXK61_07555 [Tsukamurella pseudospumae]
MIFELEPAAWERLARTVDALAEALPAPAALPLPADRYARALGAVPAASDALARDLRASSVAELRALAVRIRAGSRAATATDRSAARAIEAAG